MRSLRSAWVSFSTFAESPISLRYLAYSFGEMSLCDASRSRSSSAPSSRDETSPE